MGDVHHIKYLVSSQSDRLWGCAVNSVGCQKVAPGQEYPPGGHPMRYLFSLSRGRVLSEYQLLYITEGEGVFVSESSGWTREIQLRTGDMVLLFPGVRHSYHPDPVTGWKEYWIGFTGESMDSKVQNHFFNPASPVLRVGLHESIVSLYESAINSAIEQGSGFQQLLSGYLENILSQAWFYARNKSFSAKGLNEKMERAKLMAKEGLAGITAEQIAQELFMSYSNFRRTFKSYTGFSPSQYIRTMRIDKVKEMLTNSELPIKEVAFSCGFEDYNNFITTFRKTAGITPGEYRSLTRGETSRHKHSGRDL